MPEPYRTVLTPAGLKHPRVREFLAVRRRRADRGLAGPIALEGTWIVGRALAGGVRLEAVFACPALPGNAEGRALAAKAVGLGAEGYEVSQRVLSRLTGRDSPDGIAALGQARRRTLADISICRTTRVVIADGWDLPGNLGTLIRCADGAGASGVLVVEQGFGLTHPLVIKASMGAALTLPVVALGRPAATRWLREHGLRIVAADPAGSRSYRDADYRGPLAIVVGSERRGLAREWLAAADSIAAIPMLGNCDSLNAAVAGALLLYEALAQATSLWRGCQDSQSPGGQCLSVNLRPSLRDDYWAVRRRSTRPSWLLAGLAGVCVLGTAWLMPSPAFATRASARIAVVAAGVAAAPFTWSGAVNVERSPFAASAWHVHPAERGSKLEDFQPEIAQRRGYRFH